MIIHLVSPARHEANQRHVKRLISTFSPDIPAKEPHVVSWFDEAGTYHVKWRVVLERERRAKLLALCKNVGRNDPCPCGSGQKFKKCCIEKMREAA